MSTTINNTNEGYQRGKVMRKQYMAIDQYGQTYHGLTNPRKDLLSQLRRSHCSKMYRDDVNGNSYHIGYVISGLWLTIYEVIPMRKAL